jgi:hypothetical protein
MKSMLVQEKPLETPEEAHIRLEKLNKIMEEDTRINKESYHGRP